MVESLKAQALDLNPFITKRYRFYNSCKFSDVRKEHENNYIFKSHLMWNKIPQNLKPFKEIYLVRDGRDSLLLYYFYNVKRRGVEETWSSFFDRYQVQNKPLNYREWILSKMMGNWHTNVNSYLQLKNVKILKYEHLLDSPMDNLKESMNFLNIDFDLYRQNFEITIDKSNQKLNQKALRDKNERKRGASGGWQDYFTPAQNDLFIEKSGAILSELGYIK